jgi:hypothetical protein
VVIDDAYNHGALEAIRILLTEDRRESEQGDAETTCELTKTMHLRTSDRAKLTTTDRNLGGSCRDFRHLPNGQSDPRFAGALATEAAAVKTVFSP